MFPQRLPIVDDDDGVWGDILRKYLTKEHYNDPADADNAANGGHKNVTIRAGVATVGGAPLKFTSGTLLTTPEIGAFEFAGDNLYLTQTSGATRKKVALYNDASGATGDIYYRDSTGYFTRLAIGTANQVLTTTGTPALPTWQTQTGYIAGGTDVAVADGGTGRSTSTTAYGIIAAGTTATGAQQTIAPGTSGQFLKSAGASALASFATITKTDVGLANVDNTSDVNKPVSTATQNTINALTLDKLTRVTKQDYNPAGADRYYRLANFPIDDYANYASMIITGRLGGWTNGNMASWNILLANRSDAIDGVTVKAAVSAIGEIGPALGCCDLVMYAQPNKSAILYIRIPADQYFTYDFAYNSLQAVPAYTGTPETPTGTDVWHLWATERVEERAVQRTSTQGQVYATEWATGDQTTLTYENEAYADTIAQRYTDGRLKVGTAVDAQDAITKAQLDKVQYASTESLTSNRTLVLSDDGKVLEMNSASATTITINNAVAFPEGTMIEIVQTGAGQVSIATIGTSANPAGAKTRAQWSSIFLRKRGNTSWHVSGDTE